MLTTDDPSVWQRAWEFKDHGKSWPAVYEREHPPGYRWLHETFGTNWRLTEMQSAIGRAQLRKVNDWVKLRRQYAHLLNERFSKIVALRTTVPSPDVYHSYYKYYVFVKPEALKPGWTRDRIIEAVNAEGIPCFSGSCSEIYLEKAFSNHGLINEPLPVARKLGETSLMFLVHPTMGEPDVDDTASAVEKVMSEAVL